MCAFSSSANSGGRKRKRAFNRTPDMCFQFHMKAVTTCVFAPENKPENARYLNSEDRQSPNDQPSSAPMIARSLESP